MIAFKVGHTNTSSLARAVLPTETLLCSLMLHNLIAYQPAITPIISKILR